MKCNLSVSAIAFAIAAMSGSVMAVDSGLSVDEAQATSEVSAVVESVVSIKHVDDIDFGHLPTNFGDNYNDEIVKTDSICVYSNTSTFALQLDSTSSFGFRMTGESTGEDITYDIAIDTYGEGESGLFDLRVVDYAASGSEYGPLIMSATDENCSDFELPDQIDSGNNVTLTYTISGSSAKGAYPDVYSDTVTITARALYDIP